MAKKNNRVLNTRCFEDGGEAIKVAKQNGCTVRNGKGNHFVITPPNGQNIVVVNRKMGRSLGCKVFKMFKIAGILSFVFIIGEQILSFI